MSLHYAILDDRPERINRLRFLLHLRGIQALLAVDAAEVINWRSACRQSDAEMRGVILYFEQGNVAQLQELAAVGFDLPVYAIRIDGHDWSQGSEALDLFIGSVEEILQRLPACSVATPPRRSRTALQANS